jgi:hypothetical protein
MDYGILSMQTQNFKKGDQMCKRTNTSDGFLREIEITNQSKILQRGLHNYGQDVMLRLTSIFGLWLGVVIFFLFLDWTITAKENFLWIALGVSAILVAILRK